VAGGLRSGGLSPLGGVLRAALSVFLVAKAGAGLQAAGWVAVHPLAWVPGIGILGLYPTVEGVAVQLLTIAVLVVGFARTSAPKTVQPAP